MQSILQAQEVANNTPLYINMTYVIPNREKKSVNQLNKGDFSGFIKESKNIDLTQEGYIKLAPAPFALTTTDDDAQFTQADAMNIVGNYPYIVSSKLFYLLNDPFGKLVNLSSDTGIPSPATKQDIVKFSGKKILSYGTSIYYATSSTWTEKNLSLDNSYRTSLAVFDSYSSLLVGNSNIIKKLDTSFNVTLTLTLPSNYIVTSIAVNDNIAYIGTIDLDNKEAKLFLWNAQQAGWNNSIGCQDYCILSVKKFESSCIILTSHGKLLQFNGSSFTELAVFPIYHKDIEWQSGQLQKSVNRGMFVDKDNIYVYVLARNITLDQQFYPPFKSGIWMYNKNNGLSNYSAISYTQIQSETIATTAVDTTNNIITVASAPVTGTPLLYYASSGTVLGGLQEGICYFCIKVSSTTIKLATSLKNALAGTAIDLTGTGNNSQKLKIFNTNDYGWSFVPNTTGNEGSVIKVPAGVKETSYNYNDYLYFTGVLYAKQSTTEKTVFCATSPLIPNRGYFTTPKLQSESIEDVLDNFTIKYKELRDGEKIIVKYKNKDKVGYPIHYKRTNLTGVTGTWTDTNTFTTTGDLSSVSVGDEVELVGGVGSGFSAHITSISYNSGTYTVNLGEDFIFAVSGDKFYFVIDNWTFVKEITNETQTGDCYDSFTFNAQGKSIEFKIEMFGVGVTIEELIVSNSKLR